jgi:hypothetical protein
MQVLIREQPTKVQVQTQVSNSEPNEVVLKNKFSCKEELINVEGFICRNKAFLIINTNLPCGTYDLIKGDYLTPIVIKNG